MICTFSLNKLIYTNIVFLFQDAGETIIELPQNQSGKYFFLIHTYNFLKWYSIQQNNVRNPQLSVLSIWTGTAVIYDVEVTERGAGINKKSHCHGRFILFHVNCVCINK